jgi:uncharacterized protein DUF6876
LTKVKRSTGLNTAWSATSSCTDGAKFVQGGRRRAVSVRKLSVRDDRTATLTCDDGNGTVVYRQELGYTDFPLPEITLYFTDNVILLPSEY